MFTHKQIKHLDDFFVEKNNRPDKGVYFYRINGYTDEIGQFIQKYYEAARKQVLSLKGKFQIRMKKSGVLSGNHGDGLSDEPGIFVAESQKMASENE